MMTGKVSTFYPGSAVCSALPSYLALCLALQAPRLEAAQFRVIGPDHPITASLGGVAILSCHLSPQMSAQNMEVRWFRSQFSAAVHLYRDGKEQYKDQMPEYQGRTELLKDDITNGIVSLRIRDIRPFDDGQYKCFFQSDVTYENAILELRVADLGSAPAISVEGHQDGGIQVVCRSSGWYPEPEAQWRDLQGQRLPSTLEKNQPEAGGLFQTEIAIVLREESHQKVSCHVRNPRLNQEREATLSIAELFFPRANSWKVAIAVILPLLAVLLPLASYCFWRQHQEKETLLSDWKKKTESLQSAMESQKESLQSAMKEQKAEFEAIKAEYEAAKELGLMRAQGYAVDVTLDPDTAHPKLILSKDRKRVRLGETLQAQPDTPGRYIAYPVVLGSEGFTGGRCYWEVEVGDKTEWYLGVCKESVSRKEQIPASPRDGYWIVRLWDGEYVACTFPRTCLPVSTRPSRVGVFLDYEAGEVSFYNVTDRSHLFTFTGTFSGTLRPYFGPGGSTGDSDEYALIIRPVPALPNNVTKAQTVPSQC